MSMDDYYARIAAATRPKHRDIRTAIPNGDDFRSRGYALHKEASRIPDNEAAMPREFRDRQCLAISCRECHAKPGEPCRSLSTKRMGAELAGFHAVRAIDASKQYRK